MRCPTISVTTWSSRPRRTWSSRPRRSGHGSCGTSAAGSSSTSRPRSPTRPSTSGCSPRRRRAQAATRLSFQPRGDGSTDLHARVPDHVANRLRTYLDAYTSPRRTPLGEVDQLPVARRRGEAFVALLENVPDTGLPVMAAPPPRDGHPRPRDPAHRARGRHHFHRGPGHRRQVRRLACQARIVPVVLGGNGEVLDLGRTRRLFSPAQRKALAIRDQECTTDGCACPPSGARPITASPGPPAAGPTSPTASSSAPSTTTAPTTPAGRSTTTPTAETTFHRRT